MVFFPSECAYTPMTSILEGQYPQNKAFSNQNRCHLGSRYTYISSMRMTYTLERKTQFVTDFTTLWKKIFVGVFSIKVLQLKHQALEVGRFTPQAPRVSADLRILRSLDGRASSICAGAALLPRQTQRFHDSNRSGM